MFVSVSLVRMPPQNWGGDSDFFYRATYGPAVRGAAGLQRAVFGHVSRIMEGRPRFSHGMVFFWNDGASWEAAKRRAAGMPPLPRSAQGLETYAGDFAPAGAAAADGAEPGIIALWLFNRSESAPAEAPATAAAHLRETPGVRGVWLGGSVLVEGGDAPKPRAGVLLIEFEDREAAERGLRDGLLPAVRPESQWAADTELVCFDSFAIPLDP